MVHRTGRGTAVSAIGTSGRRRAGATGIALLREVRRARALLRPRRHAPDREAGQDRDAMLLVAYPSRRVFVDMIRDPASRAGAHRAPPTTPAPVAGSAGAAPWRRPRTGRSSPAPRLRRAATLSRGHRSSSGQLDRSSGYIARRPLGGAYSRGGRGGVSPSAPAVLRVDGRPRRPFPASSPALVPAVPPTTRTITTSAPVLSWSRWSGALRSSRAVLIYSSARGAASSAVSVRRMTATDSSSDRPW
jgi:hypothetical protein